MSIGWEEDTRGDRRGCMEQGATWLRRRGPRGSGRRAGRAEQQERDSTPHPAPPPARRDFPLRSTRTLSFPQIVFKSETFFSKYLEETLFAMSVRGSRDRILIEDSKLCLCFCTCVPPLVSASMSPSQQGGGAHGFHCLGEQMGRVDLKCLSVQHSLLHPLHQERGKTRAKMMSRVLRMRGSC